MIFSPDMLALVLAGTKTVTRRPARPGFPCRYRAGRTYSAQPGRGVNGVARIRVLSTTRTALMPLSPAELEREGFPTLAAFRERWFAMHGSGGIGEVWRIEFELADEPQDVDVAQAVAAAA